MDARVGPRVNGEEGVLCEGKTRVGVLFPCVMGQLWAQRSC